MYRKNKPGDYFYSIVSGRIYVKGKRLTGHKQHDGYIKYRYCGKSYYAGPLIWYLVTGEWPEFEIDHTDRIKSHNQWINLREATRGQNMQNVGARKDNKLGIRGVCEQSGRYVANITKDGKIHRLGRFKTVEEATEARRKAEFEYFTHVR